MHRSVQITAACLLVISLGAHWALLQTVAWTGMIIAYSQEGSIPEAVAKTFDGKHPCALCTTIQQGRADEQKRDQERLKLSSKLDFAVLWQSNDFFFGAAHELVSAPAAILSARLEAPPKPRPRLA